MFQSAGGGYVCIKHMICKNCSGEYNDEMLVCPYCGTENKEALQELKEDIQRQKVNVEKMSAEYIFGREEVDVKERVVIPGLGGLK